MLSIMDDIKQYAENELSARIFASTEGATIFAIAIITSLIPLICVSSHVLKETISNRLLGSVCFPSKEVIPFDGVNISV